jgi:hypothetical protein
MPTHQAPIIKKPDPPPHKLAKLPAKKHLILEGKRVELITKEETHKSTWPPFN